MSSGQQRYERHRAITLCIVVFAVAYNLALLVMWLVQR